MARRRVGVVVGSNVVELAMGPIHGRRRGLGGGAAGAGGVAGRGVGCAIMDGEIMARRGMDSRRLDREVVA
jgi:hypothetical protein